MQKIVEIHKKIKTTLKNNLNNDEPSPNCPQDKKPIYNCTIPIYGMSVSSVVIGEGNDTTCLNPFAKGKWDCQ
jgi:hypothetical protein